MGGDDPSTGGLDCARPAQDEREKVGKLGPRLRGDDVGAGKLGPRLRGDDKRGLRTEGGEAVVVRTKTGKLQLRMAHPGKLTKAAEQAFLLALSATANIRLAAAAAGASAKAFYRRRQQSPAFKREFRLALKMGYERLEAAALRAALPESHVDNGWRHADPPPIPRMSWDQAFQLLCLHDKSVHQGWSEPHRRRRRNETEEQHRMRLLLMWKAEQRQIAEEQAVARAERYEASGDWRMEGEEPPIPLPPLHLVTGWSKADPGKKPHDPDVALFGGWRVLRSK
jgi:hypothetical protein